MESASDQNTLIPKFNALNILIFILIITIYAYWRSTQGRKYKVSANIPGPKGLPFVGSVMIGFGTPHGKIHKN